MSVNFRINEDLLKVVDTFIREKKKLQARPPYS